MKLLTGVLCAVALALGGCAPGAPSITASGGRSTTPLSVSNGTTMPVTVTVNGAVVASLEAGAIADPISASLPPLPWSVTVTSPSGRELASLAVPFGSVSPNVGRAVRHDLSCGRLDVWVGPPLAGGTFSPGPSGDCN